MEHSCMDYRYGEYAREYEYARESGRFTCPGCGKIWRLSGGGPGRYWEPISGNTFDPDPEQDKEARRQMNLELYGGLI